MKPNNIDIDKDAGLDLDKYVLENMVSKITGPTGFLKARAEIMCILSVFYGELVKYCRAYTDQHGTYDSDLDKEIHSTMMDRLDQNKENRDSHVHECIGESGIYLEYTKEHPGSLLLANAIESARTTAIVNAEHYYNAIVNDLDKARNHVSITTSKYRAERERIALQREHIDGIPDEHKRSNFTQHTYSVDVLLELDIDQITLACSEFIIGLSPEGPDQFSKSVVEACVRVMISYSLASIVTDLDNYIRVTGNPDMSSKEDVEKYIAEMALWQPEGGIDVDRVVEMIRAYRRASQVFPGNTHLRALLDDSCSKNISAYISLCEADGLSWSEAVERFQKDLGCYAETRKDLIAHIVE